MIKKLLFSIGFSSLLYWAYGQWGPNAPEGKGISHFPSFKKVKNFTSQSESPKIDQVARDLTLEKYQGSGQISRDGEKSEGIEVGRNLREGDSLSLGNEGFAILSFSMNSQIKLQAKSEIQILRMESAMRVMKFVKGELLMSYSENGEKSFSLRVGEVNLLVAEAKFLIEQQPNNELMVVILQGEIEVSNLNTYEQAQAHAGQSFVINLNGKFSAPTNTKWVSLINWKEKSVGMNGNWLNNGHNNGPIIKNENSVLVKSTQNLVSEGRWERYQAKLAQWRLGVLKEWSELKMNTSWSASIPIPNYKEIKFDLSSPKIQSIVNSTLKTLPAASQINAAKEAVKNMENRHQHIQKAVENDE